MATTTDPSQLALTLTTSPIDGTPGIDARAYLLCFESDAATTYDLPRGGGEVIIGRAHDAHLRVHDAMVSRHHARILVMGRDVSISDLGSRHGTHVNGDQVRGPRSLISGDVLSIGGVTLVFHRSASPSRTRALLKPDSLRLRLEEEIERALHYDRTVSLLVLTQARRKGGSLDRVALATALADRVRTIDAAGFLDQEKLAVVMPELDAIQAGNVAERLLNVVGAAVPGLKIGVASCPSDGADPDTLSSSAIIACDRAQPGTWASQKDCITHLAFGDTTVLIADPAMQRVYTLLGKLAKSELSIVITGETGTGKELAASAIHHRSPRHAGPYIALNCAALSASLVESELFGHEKGAFTDAKQAKPGVFERAHRGTLFLDEVGELPLSVQAKLLRVLETRRVMRLGGIREFEVDVRVVAATNRDLEQEIENKAFRSDLFFRLGAGRITLPPLRDRQREIPLLACTLLDQACSDLSREPMDVASSAMRALVTYRWPGNIRELKNTMHFAAATAEDCETAIDVWHLPDSIVRTDGAPTTATTHAVPSAEESARLQPTAQAPPDRTPKRTEATPAAQPAVQPTGTRVFRPIADEVRELEKQRMIQALDATGWVQNKAARLISMPLRTFVTKLGRYRIRQLGADDSQEL